MVCLLFLTLTRLKFVYQSYTDYLLGTNSAHSFRILFTSEEKRFSGNERVSSGANIEYLLTGKAHKDKKNSVLLYLPSLSVIVFGKF